MPSRQYKHQQKNKALGKCVCCGKDRGADGTKNHCRVHAAQAAANATKWYRKSKASLEGKEGA